MQTIQQYTRDLYGWASEWATRLKTREVGDVCINRWDGKMRREIVPLKKRLSHLILYSRPMDVIDRWGIVRYLLDAENIHEGHDMKKPSSAAKIPDFIKFYKINMDEFENPDPSSYGTFNDFFTRRLKPGMRPIAFPDDPSIIVSPADSRVVVFEHVKTAHELWLKGKYFTLEKLIQDKGIAQIFADGAIASVRLAPQDYHHYHSPVEGYVRAWKKIDGTYYGVDGPAIKSDLDVLGSNSRCWILIETKEFGLVLFVAIGATDVGSVQLREEARETGYKLEKGEEIGLFAYGGSSVIVAFENNRVQWDEDLLANTARGLETSVLLGYSLGKAKKHPAA